MQVHSCKTPDLILQKCIFVRNLLFYVKILLFYNQIIAKMCFFAKIYICKIDVFCSKTPPNVVCFNYFCPFTRKRTMVPSLMGVCVLSWCYENSDVENTDLRHSQNSLFSNYNPPKYRLAKGCHWINFNST